MITILITTIIGISLAIYNEYCESWGSLIDYIMMSMLGGLFGDYTILHAGSKGGKK